MTVSKNCSSASRRSRTGPCSSCSTWAQPEGKVSRQRLGRYGRSCAIQGQANVPLQKCAITSAHSCRPSAHLGPQAVGQRPEPRVRRRAPIGPLDLRGDERSRSGAGGCKGKRGSQQCAMLLQMGVLATHPQSRFPTPPVFFQTTGLLAPHPAQPLTAGLKASSGGVPSDSSWQMSMCAK